MDIIELDSEKIGAIVAEHLLTLGHKKIAYISTELSDRHPARLMRLKGMRDAFAQANISPYNILVCKRLTVHRILPLTRQDIVWESGWQRNMRMLRPW